MKIIRLLTAASAAFFIAGTALAQQGGSVTQYAFAIGKGAGSTSYTSLLCGSAQLAVGQSAAAPICRTLTGDVTLTAAGVTAIGASKVLNTMIAPMTSAQLAGIISDETGTGLAVFGTSPSISSPALSGTVTGTYTLGGTPSISGAAINSGIVAGTYGGTGVNNGARTITTGGNITTAAAFTQTGAFATTLTSTATTNATLPAGTQTLAALGLTQTWTVPQYFGDSNLATLGSTSGNLVLRAPAVAGTSVIRFPAGSTDFTATGGSNQFVKQSSAGAPFTVGAVGSADMPAFTGDISTSAGSTSTTLATVNSNVGSFGSASAVPNFTVNAKGLITAAGSAAYQDATNASKGVMRGDGTTISCVAGVCQAIGASAASIGVGTTTISSGTSPYILYNNGGTLGNLQSVPVANGGTGDTGTAWTAYTPVLTAGVGSITAYTCSGASKAIGKTAFWRIKCQITNNGTSSSYLIVTLPYTAAADMAFGGREVATVGYGLAGSVTAASNAMIFRNSDNTYPPSPGTYLFTGVMEIQ